MSRKDAEIIARVHRVYDAYSRGDFDAAMEMSHPEIDLFPAGRQPPIRGAAGFRAWMEPDAFEFQVVEPLSVRVIRDKVLIHQRSRVRGSGSGIEAGFLSWTVWTLDQAGRTRRIQIFLGHEEAEALEAAGLSE